MNTAAAILAAMVLATAAQAHEPLIARPVDEAAKDRTFEMFRTVLRAAVAERNTDYVVSQTCPDILVSFGGEGGRDEFRAFLTVPEDSLSDEYKPQAAAMRDAHWAALAEVLDMGGNFTSQDEFWAPYTFNVELPGDRDPFTTYFVTGSNVLLRSGPGKDTAAISSLSYVAVTIAEYDPEAEYQPVVLANGIKGYLHRDFLRNVVDYRAGFQRGEDGAWRLCTFVAGD